MDNSFASEVVCLDVYGSRSIYAFTIGGCYLYRCTCDSNIWYILWCWSIFCIDTLTYFHIAVLCLSRFIKFTYCIVTERPRKCRKRTITTTNYCNTPCTFTRYTWFNIPPCIINFIKICLTYITYYTQCMSSASNLIMSCMFACSWSNGIVTWFSTRCYTTHCTTTTIPSRHKYLGIIALDCVQFVCTTIYLVKLLIVCSFTIYCIEGSYSGSICRISSCVKFYFYKVRCFRSHCLTL